MGGRLAVVRLFLDHNVARETAHRLRAFGHDVVTAGEQHRERATDGAHLLEVTQQGRVLVTHDTSDFLLLHDAWHRWFTAYAPRLPQTVPAHTGILIIPQPDYRRHFWLPEQAAGELHAFLAQTEQGFPLANQAYLWTVSRGWVRAPLPASRPPPAPSP